MASAYDKLRRILGLEKEQGYRDRAVIGGLARFLTYWAKEARAEAELALPPLPVAEVVSALGDYASLPAETRRETVDRLLEGLARGISLPIAAATVPLAATTAPPTATAVPLTATAVPLTATAVPVAASATPPVEVVAPTPPAAIPAPAAEAPPVPPVRRVRAAAVEALTVESPVTKLRGISAAIETRLAKLGVRTIRDLLYHFPRRYDDYTQLKTINRLALGDEVTIIGIVREAKTQRLRTGQTVVRVTVGDATGHIEARWFNQPYMEKYFAVGSEMVLSGKVGEYLGRLVLSAPEWEPLQREQLHTAGLVPVYPLTEGLGGRWMRRLIKTTLDAWALRLADPLPAALRASAGVAELGVALQQMHFPPDAAALERARQRLCFDEFLLIQLGVLRQRQAWRAQEGRAFEIPTAALDAFTTHLPFTLTGAQQRALASITTDLAQPVPMSRLLQGDVGSGKTVVAVAAVLATVRNGLQAAVMAPTAILAEQHHRTIGQLLAAMPGIRCELLLGELKAAEKARLRADIAAGAVQVVVGTHALIQTGVEFARLGLVVVDEQHRFGVEQRTALRSKGVAFPPHLLAMTATPIPRTLALTIYGDLDVSVLDELPPNRQKIITTVRGHESRERIYAFVEAQVKQGRQAFIICPLVQESDKSESKAAVAEQAHLQEVVFPHLRVGLLHGRMSAEEKDQVMADFKERAYDILVSTSVVEVGIDVPNATVMLVEGAELFGLAQLHQFRGRVGRGEHQSYCVLLSEDPSEVALDRLRFMEETQDGFLLAEKDLEMRGPGDFFGVRQSGLPALRVARLSDTAILERARQAAAALFADDAALARPEHQLLAERVQQFWTKQDLS
jgi:ATP-dependent DNA helicase RecG